MRIRIYKSCLVVMIAILLGVFWIASGCCETAGSGRIIVSLGDSYSAGEGIPPFYEQDKADKETTSADWAAHRSKKAWSGLLTLQRVGMMADHRGENWFFAAATGAETRHLTNIQDIRIHINFGYDGYFPLPPQLNIFQFLGTGNKADYVTMTLGGNDADFVGIIKEAAMSTSYLQPDNLKDKVNGIWDEFYKTGGIRDNLKKAYMSVATRAGQQATIIVAGYPQLLAPGGSGFLFNAHEAKYINRQVSYFNEEIQKAVEECAAAGVNICFVTVEEEFHGHEAYTDIPYINRVMRRQGEDHESLIFNPISAYSIHPNENGARAYARCVQKKIDQLEKERQLNQAASVAVNASDPSTVHYLPEIYPSDYRRYEGNEGDTCVFNMDKKGLPGNEFKYTRNGNVGVNGEQYSNGFEVWMARWNDESEKSWVQTFYDLNGKYTRLSGNTGLIKSYNTHNFDTMVYFYDGDRELASYRLTPDNYQYGIDVDLTGVEKLELFVEDNTAVCGGTSIALNNLELTATANAQVGSQASGSSDSDPIAHPAGDQSVEYRYDIWLYRILPDGTAEIADCYLSWDTRYYVKVPTEVESPDRTSKIKVTSIGAEAFKDNDIAHYIVIPEGVTTIKSKAFFGAGDNRYDDGITRLWVDLPASVTSIAEDAFDTSAVIEVAAAQGTYAMQYCMLHGISCVDR